MRMYQSPGLGQHRYELGHDVPYVVGAQNSRGATQGLPSGTSASVGDLTLFRHSYYSSKRSLCARPSLRDSVWNTRRATVLT